MIRIGKIFTTHGHGGGVKVQALTDYPERFEELDYVYLEGPTPMKKLNIKKIKYQANNLIVKFAELNDMEEATKLRGKFLFIDKENLKKLPEGRYYIFELKGLKVFEGEELLGSVVDVLQTGSNDVYVVRKEGRKEDILLPALKAVVTKVDLKAGTMQVIVPEGLLD